MGVELLDCIMVSGFYFKAPKIFSDYIEVVVGKYCECLKCQSGLIYAM